MTYQETIANHEQLLAELHEQITDTASTNEKRALRKREAKLLSRQEVKSEAARLEDFKLDARCRHQKQDKLDKDKKKLLFTIWGTVSEVSLQKVKEHLTTPVWLELGLNSQDPLILWNTIKATYAIVKQHNDQLTLFAAETTSR
jgi:hypothetical protein